jgi:hypothetical protein
MMGSTDIKPKANESRGADLGGHRYNMGQGYPYAGRGTPLHDTSDRRRSGGTVADGKAGTRGLPG